MVAVDNVLIVGAGASGAAAAILLADAGVAVDLVEIKPEVSALGSGITLQGNALSVCCVELGVFDECLAISAIPFSKLVIRAPDPAATIVAEVDDIPLRRPRPAVHNGHVPARPCPDPHGPRRTGRGQGPFLDHYREPRPGSATASTSPSPTARRAATTS